MTGISSVAAVQLNDVRDFAVVSCYFLDERDKRDDRDGSEVGYQRSCGCPRLRFCLSRLFRLSGLLFFFGTRETRETIGTGARSGISVVTAERFSVFTL